MRRAFLVLCLVSLFIGCQTPLAEMNYRGSLSAVAGDVNSAGDRFVSAFAEKSGFHVESRTPRSGAPKEATSVDYLLRTASKKRVVVYVTAYQNERVIAVTIAGDFSSQDAVDAAGAFESVFAQLFPGSSYVRLLGP